jgi:hypothetical protein
LAPQCLGQKLEGWKNENGIFEKKKHFLGSYWHILQTLKVNADETAEKKGKLFL